MKDIKKKKNKKTEFVVKRVYVGTQTVEQAFEGILLRELSEKKRVVNENYK